MSVGRSQFVDCARQARKTAVMNARMMGAGSPPEESAFMSVPVVPRAQRFPIVCRVLWRVRGGTDWIEGTSVNVSRSGVLCSTAHPLGVGTEVEVILPLSWGTAAYVDLADVILSGRIVRVDHDESGAGAAFASTIEDYRFIRQP